MSNNEPKGGRRLARARTRCGSRDFIAYPECGKDHSDDFFFDSTPRDVRKKRDDAEFTVAPAISPIVSAEEPCSIPPFDFLIYASLKAEQPEAHCYSILSLRGRWCLSIDHLLEDADKTVYKQTDVSSH